MQKWILTVLVLAVACAMPAFAAKEEPKPAAAPAPTAAQTQAQQEKEMLIANITNLRNQELKVAVLQQLLTDEVGRLRNIQAVFCDQYKLDVDKFRNGLYRYDDKLGKFVEVPAEPEKR